MLLELFLVIAAAITLRYLTFRSRSNYWKKLGVRQPESNPFPCGNNVQRDYRVILSKVNQGTLFYEQYQQFKREKFYGTYSNPTARPILVICDPELVKQVMVKSFNHFVDRNVRATTQLSNTKTDRAWERQLASLRGDAWKDVRSTFSPIFTAGKMKMMMTFINEISRKLLDEVSQAAKNSTPVDLKVLFGKFSMDTIASCAFGVDADSFGDQDTVFVQHAKSTFMRTSNFRKILGVMLSFPFMRKMYTSLRRPLFKPKETEFFIDVITNTMKHRASSKLRRNDLIDLMLDAIKEESDNDAKDNSAEDQFESDMTLDHKARKKNLEEFDVVATAMVMLVAGYDTTATTLSHCGYEVAMQPDVQNRLLDEIDEACAKCSDDENLDYEAIQGLQYLDMVLKETLRRHTPLDLISRGCVKDFQLPDTNITIKKGDEVHIPAIGIHLDDQYYPDPLKFNPENFNKENSAKRSPYTFLGFGQGPRACIGMRFALLEAKVALVSVLRRYKFQKCPQTPGKVTRDPQSILANSNEPLMVQLVRRDA